MTNPDVRWKQRFANFRKALFQLKLILTKDSLNSIEEQGLIHTFEYTFELAWNTIKDYYEFQVFREAGMRSELHSTVVL